MAVATVAVIFNKLITILFVVIHFEGPLKFQPSNGCLRRRQKLTEAGIGLENPVLLVIWVMSKELGVDEAGLGLPHEGSSEHRIEVLVRDAKKCHHPVDFQSGPADHLEHTGTVSVWFSTHYAVA